MEVLDLFKPLSEIPEMDTSYFQPWTLDKLYQVEPELVAIAAKTVWKRPPPAAIPRAAAGPDPALPRGGMWSCRTHSTTGRPETQ